MGDGIIGAAAQHGQAIRVGDVRKDPRYLAAVDEVRSELAVPLIVRGRVIGVMDIESRQLDYFTPAQQNILTLVASRIGTAIENARLFESAQKQAETLLLLNEIGRETSATLEVEEVLRRAAELTKRLIDYQIFSILLHDETAGVFRHHVTVKFGQRVQEKSTVPAHEGIVGAAAKLRRPIVVPDVSLDPRYRMLNPETRSELAVPMIYKKRVVGVMDLESPQLNYFTPDHVQVLSILASHLAVSIENARLYEQVARDEAAWSAISTPRAAFKARCCRDCPARNSASTSPRASSPRASSAATFTTFSATARRISASRSATSAGREARRRFTARSPIGTLRSLGSQKPRPANMLRAVNGFLGERLIEGRFMTLCFATWNRRQPPAAHGQCRPGAAAAVARRQVRKNSAGRISAGDFRRSDVRRAQLHSRSGRRDRFLLRRHRRYAESRRGILWPQARRGDRSPSTRR